MKTDYLNECNEHRVPEEDFRGMFCVRCTQIECTRSLAGNLKFDQRVATWEERFYTSVPRLDTSDPRYPSIAGQKFLTLDTSRTPEIQSSWVDPLSMTEPSTSEPAPLAELLAEKPTPSPQPPKAIPTGRLPSRMILANAQDQSGKVLESPSQQTPQAPRDPWATPEKNPTERVIRPGGTVKLGGSGV